VRAAACSVSHACGVQVRGQHRHSSSKRVTGMECPKIEHDAVATQLCVQRVRTWESWNAVSMSCLDRVTICRATLLSASSRLSSQLTGQITGQGAKLEDDVIIKIRAVGGY
jgi:hypothetical protein